MLRSAAGNGHGNFKLSPAQSVVIKNLDFCPKRNFSGQIIRPAPFFLENGRIRIFNPRREIWTPGENFADFANFETFANFANSANPRRKPIFNRAGWLDVNSAGPNF